VFECKRTEAANLIGDRRRRTFTDVVLVEDAVTSFKAFTVSGNEAEGVMDALRQGGGAHDRRLESLLAETRASCTRNKKPSPPKACSRRRREDCGS
jgi:hypothetical protein